MNIYNGLKYIIYMMKRKKQFKKNFKLFNLKSKKLGKMICSWNDIYPCLDDCTEATMFDAHYLYHPAWAARILSKNRPKKHIDISSIINFSACISAFIPIEYYEYRPINLNLNGLKTAHADLLELPFVDNSVESLSCMHVIEHIGLGRYGDNIDPMGDEKAISELKRVLSPGGNLLIVVPVGREKIMFNAHRIYSYSHILNLFDDMILEEFSLIPDDAQENGLIYNASEQDANRQKYGCGCFWFKKKF